MTFNIVELIHVGAYMLQVYFTPHPFLTRLSVGYFSSQDPSECIDALCKRQVYLWIPRSRAFTEAAYFMVTHIVYIYPKLCDLLGVVVFNFIIILYFSTYI